MEYFTFSILVITYLVNNQYSFFWQNILFQMVHIRNLKNSIKEYTSIAKQSSKQVNRCHARFMHIICLSVWLWIIRACDTVLQVHIYKWHEGCARPTKFHIATRFCRFCYVHIQRVSRILSAVIVIEWMLFIVESRWFRRSRLFRNLMFTIALPETRNAIRSIHEHYTFFSSQNNQETSNKVPRA